jgi:hypothetical protein
MGLRKASLLKASFLKNALPGGLWFVEIGNSQLYISNRITNNGRVSIEVLPFFV